jgi:predicted membrane metal-binding protein
MNNFKSYTPLLIPLASTITGIYASDSFSFSMVTFFIGLVCSVCMLLVGYFRKRNIIISLGCGVLVFFMSSLMLQLQKQEFQALLLMFEKQKTTLIGTLLEKDPWIGREGGELLRVSVCEVYQPSSQFHEHISLDVLCYTTAPTNTEVGDFIQIKYAEIKPSSNTDKQKPSYQDYLFKEGIVCSLFTRGGNQVLISHRPEWSLRRSLWKLRNGICSTLNEKLNPQTRTYFNLIFLGNKHQENNSELREFFGYWGLSHYLARSGLHIVLFIIMWTYLLCLVPLHLFFKRLLLIIMCVMYDLVSWTSIPFARAYYAFLLMKLGELLGLHINYLHILTIICLCMLLFNPLLLFFLDFQLTFLLTFILIIISHRFTINIAPDSIQTDKN